MTSTTVTTVTSMQSLTFTAFLNLLCTWPLTNESESYNQITIDVQISSTLNNDNVKQ